MSDPQPLTEQIRGRLPGLQPAMRRVAELIVRSPTQAAAMSISALAGQAATSETTVMRLCHELGVAGYSQLRLELARAVGAQERDASEFAESTDITDGDDLAHIVKKVGYGNTRSVEDTAKLISIPILSRVAELVATAPRIEIFGVGTSSIVALDLQQKFHRIGLISHANPDPYQSLVSAALLSPGCVAIGISPSGATLDTVHAVKTARDHGATTVAMTNVAGSRITKVADFVLLTAAWESRFSAGAIGGSLAQMAVVDYLFIAVAQRTFGTSVHALKDTREAVRSRKQEKHENVSQTLA